MKTITMARMESGLALVTFLLAALTCSEAHLRSRIEQQIVGGREAEPGEFPYLVLLQMRKKDSGNSSYCGGSIIHERYILTAAHCVKHVDIFQSKVGIGCHRRSECVDWRSFRRALVHPKYGNKQHDIALVELEHDIDFNELVGMSFVGMIPLALYDVYNMPDSPHEMLILAGWGRTNHDPSLDEEQNKIQFKSEVLKRIQIPLIPLESCARNYKNVSEDNICAGGLGHGQCRGDSGGPLLHHSPSGNLVQVGLVSRSISCATEAGGVFTRVAPYHDWIEDCIEQRPECEVMVL